MFGNSHLLESDGVIRSFKQFFKITSWKKYDFLHLYFLQSVIDANEFLIK